MTRLPPSCQKWRADVIASINGVRPAPLRVVLVRRMAALRNRCRPLEGRLQVRTSCRNAERGKPRIEDDRRPTTLHAREDTDIRKTLEAFQRRAGAGVCGETE